MKAANTKQLGFFDLGLSALILAIGGTVALSVNHVEDKKAALQQEQIEVVMDQQAATTEVATVEPGHLDQTVQ